jgi:hypothetical protein
MRKDRVAKLESIGFPVGQVETSDSIGIVAGFRSYVGWDGRFQQLIQYSQMNLWELRRAGSV